MCPQSLFKFKPDFDLVLRDILQAFDGSSRDIDIDIEVRLYLPGSSSSLAMMMMMMIMIMCFGSSHAVTTNLTEKS